MASSDAVFQTFVVSAARTMPSTCWVRPVMGWWSPTSAPVTTGWIQRVTSFAWLMFNAICKRWRNTLAVDKRPTLVVGSCCYSRACSAPSIVTRLNSSLSHCGSGGCSDYDEVSGALDQGLRGTSPTLRRTLPAYSLRYEAGLWVFYSTGERR